MTNLKKIFPLLLVSLIITICWFFIEKPKIDKPEICFNFTKNTEGWIANSDNSWYWSIEGKALSHNWNNRPAIVSGSQGAIVFNGDSLSAKGVVPDIFTITSPLIYTPTVNKKGKSVNKLGVTFKQYFKNFKGKARLEVKPEKGDWVSYPLNENFGDFMESLPDTSVFVDISDVILPTTACFNIRFVYEGTGSFWIIDDVCVEDITDRRITKPAALAKKLCDNNYPFLTDDLGGAYIPNEVVVEFADKTKADSIRDLFQVTEYESCNCNNIELWKSPIVLTPLKIMSNHFPLEIDTSFTIENLPSSGECIDSSYMITKLGQRLESCRSFNEGNSFSQNTAGSLNSGMLLIHGAQNAQFNLSNIPLKKDSLYVLSFYARSLAGEITPELELQIENVPFDTIVVNTTEGWGRYDVLLKDTISDGLLSLRQISNGGIYAIDDICLSQYILADNTIINFNGVIEKGTSSTEINEGDPNYYNFDTQKDIISDSIPDIGTAPSNHTDTNSMKIIAVLDTGIDYNYNDNNINIKDKIYYNPEAVCFENDTGGYNFVDTLSPPYDNSHSGHGTHVAGIIIQNIPDNLICDYRLLPLKTHDTLGMSTLFRVSCAVSYATQAGADFINASWGYYGEESPILRHAIEDAQNSNITFVCSAGNDGLDVVIDSHWPSAFELDNVITVAATNDTTDNQVIELATFSNTSVSRVDYVTAGVNIKSAVPAHTYLGANIKSGTSMAAPRMLSVLLTEDCQCPTTVNKPTFSSSNPRLDTTVMNYQYVDTSIAIRNIQSSCQ